MERAVTVWDRMRMSMITKSPIDNSMDLVKRRESEGIGSFKGFLRDDVGITDSGGVVDSCGGG